MRNSRHLQGAFQSARKSVKAQKDGKVVIGELVTGLCPQSLDFVGNVLGLGASGLSRKGEPDIRRALVV